MGLNCSMHRRVERPFDKSSCGTEDRNHMESREICYEGRNGLNWLRVRSSDGVLRTRCRISEFSISVRLADHINDCRPPKDVIRVRTLCDRKYLLSIMCFFMN